MYHKDETGEVEKLLRQGIGRRWSESGEFRQLRKGGRGSNTEGCGSNLTPTRSHDGVATGGLRALVGVAASKDAGRWGHTRLPRELKVGTAGACCTTLGPAARVGVRQGHATGAHTSRLVVVRLPMEARDDPRGRLLGGETWIDPQAVCRVMEIWRLRVWWLRRIAHKTRGDTGDTRVYTGLDLWRVKPYIQFGVCIAWWKESRSVADLVCVGLSSSGRPRSPYIG
jgi:hypothetical protein